jgi:predicted nucleic acid-binding protein
MRRPAGLSHRFDQYSARLYTSAVVLAELYAGAYRMPSPHRHLSEIAELLLAVKVLPLQHADAETFGQIKAKLATKGRTVNPLDLLIAATALSHDYTLVTHNVKHFEVIPDLRIEDWLAP